MAREPHFMLDCSSYSDQISDIVVAFRRIGWRGVNGMLECLPLYDQDACNWQSVPYGKESMRMICQKQACGELCGVVLYHADSGRGITLLARDTKAVMVIPDVNRKTICGDFTDASWYIEHIIAPMETLCGPMTVEYREVIG